MAAPWQRTNWPSHLLVAALALLAVSQFFPYTDQMPILRGPVDDPFAAASGPGVGWTQHPHAYVILPLMAFVFLHDDIKTSGWFRRWGIWVGLVPLALCLLPGQPWQTGTMIGMFALALAVLAALAHTVRLGRPS